MKLLKTTLYAIGIYLLMSCGTNKILDQVTLNHMPIAQLNTVVSEPDKPTVVFLHAPWCTYCRNMEHTTFKNAQVVQKLNSNFNFIGFDGESKEDVFYNGKIYKYIPNSTRSGTHELASYLGTDSDQLLYPTLVLMEPDGDIVERYSTFLSSSDLLTILEIVSNL